MEELRLCHIQKLDIIAIHSVFSVNSPIRMIQLNINKKCQIPSFNQDHGDHIFSTFQIASPTQRQNVDQRKVMTKKVETKKVETKKVETKRVETKSKMDKVLLKETKRVENKKVNNNQPQKMVENKKANNKKEKALLKVHHQLLLNLDMSHTNIQVFLSSISATYNIAQISTRE
jgi:hypothetical protein